MSLIEPQIPAAIDLSELWRLLMAGTARVVSGYCTEQNACLEIEFLRGKTRPLRPRDAKLLERALLGESQKLIALDLERAVSTIATLVGRAVLDLGLSCRVSQAPVALVMVVHAAHDPNVRRQATLRCLEAGSAPRFIVSLPRPERAFRAGLNPAERDIVRLRVEGMSYEEMAQSRKTSPRTIANQVGAVYRKLNVSGRLALLASIVKSADEREGRDQRPALRALSPARAIG
jgi:DNA-binding CsgD family transcriptional regulator